MTKYRVRRLTPGECERLQAFPSGWTLLQPKTEMDADELAFWNNVRAENARVMNKKYKPQDERQMLNWYNKMIAADSPRYMALGNSIAIPQWYWIFRKMEKYLPEHATMASLFDGIGGFPLAWETIHGEGTAVWASEIEPFPIAVTKERLGE